MQLEHMFKVSENYSVLGNSGASCQQITEYMPTRKTAGTAENPARQQAALCAIQINNK